jgi:MFS family permease
MPFGSCIGLVVVNGAISLFSFGVFIKPLEAEFGWDRASISSAIALCALASAFSVPFVGILMDRFGVRRVMIISIFLFAANVAAIGLSRSIVTFVLLTALTGVTGVGQGPIGYVKSISSYFDRHRGIAIGIAISGTGVGTALLPLYTQWLIGQVGWRWAYAGLGLVLIALAWPAVILFVREPGASPSAQRARARSGVTALPGATAREAIASRTFWILICTIFFVSTVVNGSIVHVVSLLTDRGWSSEAAAAVMVWVGLASLVGRLVVGYLLDRVFAPYVAIGLFLVALGGLYLLASGKNAYLGVSGIGMTGGAEVDVIAYMISRYFGLRRFGQIYGYQFGVFLVGAGLGPMLMGAAHTRLDSYDLPFQVFGVLLVLASLLMLFMGRYTYPADDLRDGDREPPALPIVTAE